MTSFMIGAAVRRHPDVAAEFEQLYAEGATRRRMMVIGLHERISGHASPVSGLPGRSA